ncbi:MAG TPA: hypothetical protein VMU13_03750 [Candidatus Paceibacterota bacterium]|nr:hypothetical protein [Candidatus Paceibacterota bacterium]
MQHIGSHLNRTIQKARQTERGELMKYFLSYLNPGRVNDGLPKMTMGHLGKLFEKIPTKDLYYLKRVCNDAPNFSKKFWWEINPKHHTEEALASQKKKFKKLT